MPEASRCCCWHQKAAEPGRREEVLLSRAYQEHAIAVAAAWCYPALLSSGSPVTGKTGHQFSPPGPGVQGQASRCLSQSLRRTSSWKPAPAWCFPRLIFYYTWSFPVSHLTALPSARATSWVKLYGQTGCTRAQGEGAARGCSCVLMHFLEWLQSAEQGSPSWKLFHILGRKRIQNALSWLLWICGPPSELSKEVQASLNSTNAASWSIKGPGGNFIKSDGEESKPIWVNSYIIWILIQATELKRNENSFGENGIWSKAVF